jgi:hypothetical protein
MSALAHPAPAPTLGAPALALAAVGPVAIGAIVATHGDSPLPLAAVPAVVFGVVAATSPALYIATAATGTAPPLARVIRAFGSALGAFGIALAGLLLPAAFLALTSTATWTTFVVATAALGGAAVLALRRLARELAAESSQRSLTASMLFITWAAATTGIAGRLWWDLATEVMR